MGQRSDSRRAKLSDYLAALAGGQFDVQHWLEAKELLAPISDSYLRALLLRSGHPLAPAVEGVRHDTFENFERTLSSLPPGGQSRRLVIESKQRLRWLLRGADGDRLTELEEMLLWTQTWLENPAVFEAWRALRKKATESESPRRPPRRRPVGPTPEP